MKKGDRVRLLSGKYKYCEGVLRNLSSKSNVVPSLWLVRLATSDGWRNILMKPSNLQRIR